MSKKQYPKSNLAEKVNETVVKDLDDLLNSRPQSEIEAEKKRRDETELGEPTPTIAPKENLNEKEATSKKLEGILKSKNQTENKIENFEFRVKPNVRIYFEEGNYSRFENMFDELKKQVRQQTGKKLKETGMSELSIMLIVEEFEKRGEFEMGHFQLQPGKVGQVLIDAANEILTRATEK